MNINSYKEKAQKIQLLLEKLPSGNSGSNNELPLSIKPLMISSSLIVVTVVTLIAYITWWGFQ